MATEHRTEQEQAQRILALAMARMASRVAPKVAVGRVALTREQLQSGIKAKLVGKGGVVARHFQEQSGVDLLLNEEEEAIWVSCFDPFRREVGRRAIEFLIADGRINLTQIEQAIESARKATDTAARTLGAHALQELGLEPAHPAITRVLGTLNFRTSFGQNQLEHSIETAWIAGMLAEELGADVLLARRAGLLHDLGKALDPTHRGGHARAGAEFAERYGEGSAIVDAIAAHHEEVPAESWLAGVVIAADALSGARPGARPGSREVLFERMAQMEAVAKSFAGVKEAFAIQAGREVRVFVDANLLGDEETRRLAPLLAQRIQREVEFPGEIGITVHRELRVTEVAAR